MLLCVIICAWIVPQCRLAEGMQHTAIVLQYPFYVTSHSHSLALCQLLLARKGACVRAQTVKSAEPGPCLDPPCQPSHGLHRRHRPTLSFLFKAAPFWLHIWSISQLAADDVAKRALHTAPLICLPRTGSTAACLDMTPTAGTATPAATRRPRALSPLGPQQERALHAAFGGSPLVFGARAAVPGAADPAGVSTPAAAVSTPTRQALCVPAPAAAREDAWAPEVVPAGCGQGAQEPQEGKGGGPSRAAALLACYGTPASHVARPAVLGDEEQVARGEAGRGGRGSPAPPALTTPKCEVDAGITPPGEMGLPAHERAAQWQRDDEDSEGGRRACHRSGTVAAPGPGSSSAAAGDVSGAQAGSSWEQGAAARRSQGMEIEAVLKAEELEGVQGVAQELRAKQEVQDEEAGGPAHVAVEEGAAAGGQEKGSKGSGCCLLLEDEEAGILEAAGILQVRGARAVHVRTACTLCVHTQGAFARPRPCTRKHRACTQAGSRPRDFTGSPVAVGGKSGRCPPFNSCGNLCVLSATVAACCLALQA